MFSAGTATVDGSSIRDVAQQAATNFLEAMSKKSDKYLKKRATKAFVLSSLRTQVKQIIAGLCRKRAIRIRGTESIKTTYYANANSGWADKFEQVEIDNFKHNLSPSFKAFVRLLEDGKTIAQIKKAFGVTSTRRYYKIYNNLKKSANRLGYTKIGDDQED